MRENRMHVMHDYLDKERRRPESKDPRLNGSGRPYNGRRNLNGRDSTKTTLDSQTTPNGLRRDISRLTPAESVRSNGSSHDTSDQESAYSAKRRAPSSENRSKTTAEPVAVARRTYSSPTDEQRLVTGIGGSFENSTYNRASLEDVPTRLRGQLEPFGTCKLNRLE